MASVRQVAGNASLSTLSQGIGDDPLPDRFDGRIELGPADPGAMPSIPADGESLDGENGDLLTRDPSLRLHNAKLPDSSTDLLRSSHDRVGHDSAAQVGESLYGPTSHTVLHGVGTQAAPFSHLSQVQEQQPVQAYGSARYTYYLQQPQQDLKETGARVQKFKDNRIGSKAEVLQKGRWQPGIGNSMESAP